MQGISGIAGLEGTSVVNAELGAAAIRHAATGCTVTADATLYYREELLASLGLDDDAGDDTALILAAYLRWGEACVDHLEGDFAFVIHDPRTQSLFCARDPYGLRPFYYHYVASERFVFASDAREVLRFPQVPFAINEGRIADYIVQELEWIDFTSTFYQDVYRLPPAHTITINASGLRLAEYRVPALGPELGLQTDEDYKDAFLEVFSRAVFERQKVRGGEAGSMLSGGMDSGSIVAVAEKPLRTYSLARRRGKDCAESRRIYATLDFLGFEGTQIIADEPDDRLDELGAGLAEPFDGHFLFLKAIYSLAKRDGMSAVLDGAAGDLVFNEGAYIARLLRRGRFGRAWREAEGEKAFWERRSAVPAFLGYAASAFTPGFAKRWARGPRQRWRRRGYIKASLISREFAEHVDIEKRFERMRETFSGLQSDDPGLERVRKIRPSLTAGRERYGRLAASVGMEARDPYTDLRVVDFCSRLPDEQVARDGWSKFLQRFAMAGRLPEAVRWGPGKPHLGGVYNETYLRQQQAAQRLGFDSVRAALGPYVDAGALRDAWRAFDTGGSAEAVHTACILSLWLETSVTRPIVNDHRLG